MTWQLALAFLLGMAALPFSYVAYVAGKELRTLWRDHAYYARPENVGALRASGRVLHRLMGLFKGKPPEPQAPADPTRCICGGPNAQGNHDSTCPQRKP